MDLVDSAIEKVIDEFKLYPDVFLTEEDVRCHLVSHLLQDKTLGSISKTAEGSRSVSIHAEVRWYGHSRKLKYRSDIVILDVESLHTKEPFRLPSKGYAFDKFSAVIELKLRRLQKRGDSKFISMIDYDFERLKTLIDDTRNATQAKYYLLCLDKKSDISDALDKYKNESQIDFRYVFKSI